MISEPGYFFSILLYGNLSALPQADATSHGRADIQTSKAGTDYHI
jgi:uncharacterized membrane protein YiaA